MKKIWLVSVSLFLMAGALFASDDSASDDSDSEEVIEEDRFPLHTAIMNEEDMEVIQALIDQGYNVNQGYETYDIFDPCKDLTPALIAAQKGNLVALQALYAAGADLNLEEDHDSYKKTPLAQAIKYNKFDIVTWLLDQRDAQGNFVVNRRKEYIRDDVGTTLFDYVLERLNGYLWIPDPERNALPDRNPDKYLPACLVRDEDGSVGVRENIDPEVAAYFLLLKRFLQEDRSILNSRDSNGKTPLFNAIEKRFNPYLITTLYALGADITIPGPGGKTPLLVAIENAQANHNPSVVSFLLEQGALPDATDDAGHVPLVEAIKKNVPVSVQRLLMYGANPNVYDQSGITPLIASIQKTNGRYIGPGYAIHQPSFDALLASDIIPVDVNMPDTQGRTPLWHACHTSWANGFGLLLRNGAVINKDVYDEVLIAEKRLLFPFLKQIVDHYPSFDFSMQDVWGDTALLCLLYQQNPAVSVFLDSLKAKRFEQSVTMQNLSGQTPLMLAAKNGSLELLVKLVGYHGARVDQVDKDGKTVFNFIDDYIKAQNDEIAQMPDGPEKQKKLKKVKDLSDYKPYLCELEEQAQEMRLQQYPEALAVADKADAYALQLQLAKEAAFDVADRVDQQLQLAKRPHLGDE